MDKYESKLRSARSISFVTTIQQRSDVSARQLVQSFDGELNWSDRSSYAISERAWKYVTADLKCEAHLVFCHPELLGRLPRTSLYYRGMCALSLKETKRVASSVQDLEDPAKNRSLNSEKAAALAAFYNTFICSILLNTLNWTLEDGYRTMLANFGITLDGRERNRIGIVAEDHMKTLMAHWLFERGLILQPNLTEEGFKAPLPRSFLLPGSVTMVFASDPDVAFVSGSAETLAIIEIKGGTDPAGALERYGAAQKPFQNARSTSPKCATFYVGAIFTKELLARMKKDANTSRHFSLIDIVDDPHVRGEFFDELFHYTLKLSGSPSI